MSVSLEDHTVSLARRGSWGYRPIKVTANDYEPFEQDDLILRFSRV